ncbi:MAG: tetratricopeptide (TPR) repeat protein [Myxococcota bacterium]|jgi:tetratricopeptide (TPR) repeat protein
MAAGTTPKSPSNLPRSRAGRQLTLAVVACWGVAWAGLGGVLPHAMVALHIALAIGCALALRQAPRHLAKAGALWPWLAAGGLVALPLGASLIPLPATVLAHVAPGRVAAWPGLGWGPATSDVASTLEAGAVGLSVLTFAVLMTVVGVRGASRRRVERGIVIVSAVVVATALVHGLGGLDRAFGIIPVQASGVHYLPLVNDNHLSALLVLVLPTLVGRTCDAQDETERALTATLLSATWLLVLLLQSVAGVGAAALVTGLAAARLGLTPTRILGIGVFAAPAAIAWAVLGPRAVGPHVRARLHHWADALGLWWDHWLLGAGAGTYALAMGPYRTDTAFVTWTHAHDEPLHALAETGIVGVVALCIAAAFLRPRAVTSDRPTAWRLDLGLAGLGLCALVDFPLHVPAIALAAAALWSVRLSVHGPLRPTRVGAVRAALVGLLLLQLPSGLIAVHRVVLDRAVEQHRGGSPDRLAWWAPDHPRLALDGLGVPGGAEQLLERAAGSPEVLVMAADRLAADLDDALALRALARAEERAPSDRRIAVRQAWLHTRSNQLAEAAAAWARAFTLDAPPSHVRAAVATLPLGSWWLRELDRARPAHLVALARVVVDTEPQVAVEALERAALRAPGAYGWLPERAAALRAAGRLDDALAWTTEGIEANPASGALWWEHAVGLREQGQVEAAQEAARTAGASDPRFGFRAVRMTADLAGPEAGLELIRELQLRGGVRPDVLLEGARLHLRAGRPGPCRAAIERLDTTHDDALAAAAARLAERCR